MYKALGSVSNTILGGGEARRNEERGKRGKEGGREGSREGKTLLV